MYVRNRPVWNSKKYGAIKLTLQFDKDGNALSACNDATDRLAQIIVTELKLYVPCFKITEDFDHDLLKVHNEVQTFESYRVFPMAVAATQQTLQSKLVSIMSLVLVYYQELLVKKIK